MADLIERYKITANLPSVMMNYCNRFNSKQIELITEMIYELENSIESCSDVQPLSVVAEHIKNRLYETALNTIEAVASDTIADMAERIDFWIDELKDGDTECQ